MIGAVEAQMAEGCLHLHFFMFLQNAFQFQTLEEIAQSLRSKLLSGQAWKDFVSHVRCGAYPDPEKFDAERADIEKAWPAFANDPSLSRLDADLWLASPGNDADGLCEKCPPVLTKSALLVINGKGLAIIFVRLGCLVCTRVCSGDCT